MSLGALQAGLGAEWPFESFPEYLDAIEARGVAVNVGALVGHTPVRTFVLGEDAANREATVDEIAAMRAIVREALEAGALGFATSKAPTHVGYGGNPVPSRAASAAEIDALAGCARRGAPRRGAVHDRPGPLLRRVRGHRPRHREARHVDGAALGLLRPEGPPHHPRALRQAPSRGRAGRAPGVLPAALPRVPVEGTLPVREPARASARSLRRTSRGASTSTPTRRSARRSGPASTAAPCARASTAWCSPNTRPTPRSASARSGTSPPSAARTRSTWPSTSRSTRSSRRASASPPRIRTTKTWPSSSRTRRRCSGSPTQAPTRASSATRARLRRYSASWVREKGALTLEEGVRRLTSEPAEIFGVLGRGRLAVGLAADVTVFDPATVGCDPVRRVLRLPGRRGSARGRRVGDPLRNRKRDRDP